MRRERKRGEMVEKGDKLITTTAFGSSSFEITRVTKTLCFSEREEDKYEFKWRRDVSSAMCYPYRQWNTTSYIVLAGEEDNE